MKKLNKIISLCLTSFMGISIVHANEKNNNTQEISVDRGEFQVKRSKSIDPNTKNKLRNGLLIGVPSIAVVGTALGYKIISEKTEKLKNNMLSHICLEVEKRINRINNSIVKQRWQILDKDSLKHTLSSILDLCSDDESEVEAKYFDDFISPTRKRMRNMYRVFIKFIGCELLLPPKDFPKEGETRIFDIGRGSITLKNAIDKLEIGFIKNY